MIPTLDGEEVDDGGSILEVRVRSRSTLDDFHSQGEDGREGGNGGGSILEAIVRSRSTMGPLEVSGMLSNGEKLSQSKIS